MPATALSRDAMSVTRATMVAMPVNFTAIDFETANSDPASACAVGLVRVRRGEVVARDGWLIKPPAGHDEFMPFNVQLHGVSRERVQSAPTWSEQLPRLLSWVGSDVLVAHNANFDLGVIAAACMATASEHEQLPPLKYFCSLRLARKVYELPRYRLPVAAEAAGFIELNHHDPISDAEAAAWIVIDSAARMKAPDIYRLGKVSGVQISELDLEARRAAALELVKDATF